LAVQFLPVAALVLLTGAGPSLTDLSDDPLRIELANDGLGTLLDRAFMVDHIPDSRRGPERAVMALRQLSDSKLSDTDRAARLRDIVGGIATALPQMNDPQVLLSAAAPLVQQGVVPAVNILEYFGEDSSDATKARLQPIVATAVALYARAVAILNQQQAALSDRITKPDDPAVGPWRRLYQDYQTASYTRWMLQYSLALSLDKADKNRVDLCNEAITNLDQWDSPDSGVQPIVRLQFGKLWMIAGSRSDLKRAQEIFNNLITAAPGDGGVQPPPDRYTRFNARYFNAVCDILLGDAAAAQSDAQTAEDYRATALPDVVEDQWAMDMLHYRIAVLTNDSAAAVKILEDLSDKAPSLRPVIAGQLLDKLPPNPDVEKLSPLMLSALVARSWQQLKAPTPDPAMLNLGLAAANRYVKLADASDPQTTPAAAMDASKIRGVILKATAAFLDHAYRYKDDPSPDPQAGGAINEAIDQIGILHKNADAGTHQADVAALEDKLLPLAVESFRRYGLAYDYARHLQRTAQPARAAAVFDLVPADDPNAFNALFFKMVALSQRLESDPHDGANAVGANEMAAVVEQIQKLAQKVSTQAAANESAATDAAQKRQYQSLRVRTALLAAQVANRDGHDPHAALATLADFEKIIPGLPDENALLGQALNLRVAAYMAAADTSKATDTLVQYLNTVGGNQGLQTVYNLLTQLNKELDHAQAAADAPRIKELTDDRAALTPFLVQWASSNINPDITKFTYRYRVFDAATQKQAAELESNPASRQEKLKAALARYQSLQSPENSALYKASLPPDAAPDTRDYPDPAVTLGIADIAFDQGDWKLAHDSIGQLLADSKVGDGTIVVKNAAGQPETADNEQFWEAQYKFIYSTAQMAKDPSSGVTPDTAPTILARLSAIWQDHIGGVKWHAKFAELAAELKP
jgi:hypothetical protein